MTKRRSRGEGTIYRRRDGRWVGMYTVQTLDGVKRRCVYGRTKAEARVKLTEAIASRDKGLVFDAGNLSVGEYLDKWLEAIRNTIGERTWKRHESIVRIRLKPAIGKAKLATLSNRSQTVSPLLPRGVVYVPPSFPDQEMETSEANLQGRERTVPIYTVAPEVFPQAFRVKVEDNEGTPIAGAHILAVAANGTYQEVRTDQQGEGNVVVPMRRLLTIFCAHQAFPAWIERDFDPINDLQVTLPRGKSAGSFICASGTGHVPGLEGRLNPIRDTIDRLYLYADNIAIAGVKQQPVAFELGRPFEVEDKNGRTFDLKIIEVIGRSSLIEFTER